MLSIQPVLVLRAMQEEAKRLGVTGVASLLYRPARDRDFITYSRIVGRLERTSDPTRGKDDSGTNYAAVAFSKLAETLSTGKPSGLADRALRTGELGYQGSLPYEDALGNMYIFAFSGGTANQDVLISRAGMSAAVL